MELTQLRQFMIAAKYENVSKAAESLYITQPTLSQAIKRLEDELGLELFDRTGGKIKLTQIGYEIYEQVQKVIREVDEIPKIVDDYLYETKDVLNVMSVSTMVVKTFINQYIVNEKKNLNVSISTDIGVTEKLLNDDYDIAITSEEVFDRRITQVPFATEQIVVAVPKDSVLGKINASTYKEVIDLSNSYQVKYITVPITRMQVDIVKATNKNFRLKYNNYGIEPQNVISPINDLFASNVLMSTQSQYAFFDSCINEHYLHDNPNMNYIRILDHDAKFQYYITYKNDNYEKCKSFILWLLENKKI